MIVDLASPIDPDHPLNAGREWWGAFGPHLTGLSAGTRVYDLVGNRAGALTAGHVLEGNGSLFNSASTTAAADIPQWFTGTPFTVACWATVNATSVPHRAVRFRYFAPSLRTSTLSGGRIGFVRDGSAWVASGETAVAGRRYRLLLARRSGTVTLYLDGNPLVSSGDAVAADTNWSLTNSGESALGCRLADPSLWSRELSAAEAAEDYELALAEYRVPYSPLRWVRPVSWFAGVTGPAVVPGWVPTAVPGFSWC